MTFKATVESGRIAFPKEALEELGLQDNSTFEFEVEGMTLRLKPAKDMRAFEAWADKYAGSMREQFLADGYTSVDEYMKEIRPEW